MHRAKEAERGRGPGASETRGPGAPHGAAGPAHATARPRAFGKAPGVYVFPETLLRNSHAANGLYFLGLRDDCAKHGILEGI